MVLIIVNYDNLAQEPRRVLTHLYDALGEPWFQHDFDNVIHDEPAYDEDLGLPGLHRVRRRVAPEQRSPRIPPDLFAKFADTAFWTLPRLNVNNVTTL